MGKNECVWEEWENELWESSCGNSMQAFGKDIVEKFAYCPFCGKKIVLEVIGDE